MTREEWDNCEDLQAMMEHLQECCRLDKKCVDDITHRLGKYYRDCHLRIIDLLPESRSRRYALTIVGNAEEYNIRLDNDDFFAIGSGGIFYSTEPADIELVDRWAQELTSKQHPPHVAEWLKHYEPRELLKRAASDIRLFYFYGGVTRNSSLSIFDDLNLFRKHFPYREAKSQPVELPTIKPMMTNSIKFSIDESWHVVWVIRWDGRDHFRHAIGQGDTGNRVTNDLAERRFHQGRTQSCWLPILFPQRALMLNKRSINCVTAAIRAFIRGWCYFP